VAWGTDLVIVLSLVSLGWCRSIDQFCCSVVFFILEMVLTSYHAVTDSFGLIFGKMISQFPSFVSLMLYGSMWLIIKVYEAELTAKVRASFL
jgi:hypothetical protein